MATAAGLSHEEIEPNLKPASIGPGRRKLVGDLVPYIAEEWGLDPEVSPTGAALFVLLPPAFGALTAYLTLAKLAQEKARRENGNPNGNSKP